MAIAIITAKAMSSRLPGKNVLPLGGQPLAVWSIRSAIGAGLRTIVVTDIKEIALHAESLGCDTVNHPQGMTHQEVIEYGLRECNASGQVSVLLQPTSPFREGNIIGKCIKRHESTGRTVLSCSHNHWATVESGGLVNLGRSVTMWDGCVAVFAPGGVCDFRAVETVRNLPANSLQIDTEEDYAVACETLERIRPLKPTVPPAISGILGAMIRQAGVHGPVTVVCREGDLEPDESRPVLYVNHCRGYKGGRCDVLFLIANQHMQSEGVNPEMAECARKCRIAIIRDNGHLPWLMSSLPEIEGKVVPIRGCIDRLDDRVTSGAILCDILSSCGIEFRVIGMYRPSRVSQSLGAFHAPAMSREIGILRNAGVFDASFA